MSDNRRHIFNSQREPVQQSMTIRPSDYRGVFNQNTNMLGIILEIYPADDPRNRYSAGFDDYRGYCPTARVLIIDDGSNAQTTLEQVMITPDSVCGIDDYQEKIPRASTKLVTGDTTTSQGNNYDPNLLDGDRCIVSFIGGSIDKPFVSRWWPHSKNFYDPATSGTGNPNNGGTGTTLEQTPRFFQRVNGVETVVNGQGDVLVSTSLANSVVQPEDGAVNGRYVRVAREDGGSVKLWVKPSQTLEFDFNAQVDGLGVQGAADPEMPQANPRGTQPMSGQSLDNTYVKLTKTQVEYYVPTEFKVVSKSDVTITADSEVNVTAQSNITVDSKATASIFASNDIQLSSNQAVRVDSISETVITAGAYVRTVGPSTQLSTGQVLLGLTPIYPIYGSTVINGVIVVQQQAVNAVFENPSSTDSAKIEVLQKALDAIMTAFLQNITTTVLAGP